MTRRGARGRYFIVQPTPTSIYLQGPGASSLGDRPFLDLLDFSEEETKNTIAKLHRAFNVILDPHSAIGFYALKKLVSLDNNYSYFCLETAHPCKFPDAIHDAIQMDPPVPNFVKEIFAKKEKFVVLKNDLDSLKKYIILKAS